MLEGFGFRIYGLGLGPYNYKVMFGPHGDYIHMD